MTDSKGDLLTSDKAIHNRALKVYANRLKGYKVEPNLEALANYVNDLCEIRIKLAKHKESIPTNMNDLKEVLKHLGNAQSRDQEGMINEIFKEAVAGADKLEAVLKVMNSMKKAHEYPTECT